MARRRAVKWAQDQDGPVVGGTGYEGRLYPVESASLATLYLASSGATTVANPHSPNAGTQTSSSANMLSTDDSIAVLSTAGFAVGDVVPIDGSAGRVYGVIKVVTDATHLQFTTTLAAMETIAGIGAATMNSGALVGGPEMYGHWQAWVDDTSDYDFTLKNLATGKEGPRESVSTLQTSAVVAFQDEGVSTGASRSTLNFIGPAITAVDNAGASRVDVTVAEVGKELGAATANSNQTITSTTSPGTDITGLTVTVTPNGTNPVYVDLFLPGVYQSTATADTFIVIQKDGAVVQKAALNVATVNDDQTPVFVRYRDPAPTNASHTYKASLYSSSAQSVVINSQTDRIALITVTQVKS